MTANGLVTEPGVYKTPLGILRQEPDCNARRSGVCIDFVMFYKAV